MHICKHGAVFIGLFCALLLLIGCGGNGSSVAAAPRTVTVTAITTYWGPDGTTEVPNTVGPIMFPQQNGTYATIQPTDAGNGTFVYDDVPAGYYWLTLPGVRSRWYWTSSSNIDVGTDAVGPHFVLQSVPTQTSFSVNLSGLDATQAQSLVQTLSYPAGIFASGVVQGSTTFSGSGGIEVGSDVTAIHYALFTQNEPALLGGEQGYVLGPTLTLSDLSLSNGITNPISGTLIPSPQASQALKIDGSRWNGLFDHVASAAPIPLGSPFRLAAQPFVPEGTIGSASPQLSPSLFWPAAVSQGTVFGVPFLSIDADICQSNQSILGNTTVSPPPAPPLIQTDVDLGIISYGDPFPAEWQRVFSFCQQAIVNLPPLNSTDNPIYFLSNWQKTVPPTADVKPLVSSVVNPRINGSSLFSPASLQTKAVRLSWSKPALGAPFGYRVGVITTETFSPAVGSPFEVYSQVYTLNTAQTSLIVPPQLLTAGNTYLFTITALVDGAANMETRPLRSALPAGGADVISAPIAISASAQ